MVLKKSIPVLVSAVDTASRNIARNVLPASPFLKNPTLAPTELRVASSHSSPFLNAFTIVPSMNSSYIRSSLRACSGTDFGGATHTTWPSRVITDRNLPNPQTLLLFTLSFLYRITLNCLPFHTQFFWESSGEG